MLGRLFKQNSTSSLNSNQSPNGSHPSLSNSTNPHSHSGVNSHKTHINNVNGNAFQNFNSYEDSYTREILYGTSDVLKLKPYHFNNKFFRIVISQDGGNLRSKQVLYDSSVQNNESSVCCTNKIPNIGRGNGANNVNNKNILTSKIHHNASELNDYMFGCGLPSSETYCSTKIHILPVLNNSTYGSNQSVLITRLFSISDEVFSCNEQNIDSTWKPYPTLPIKETTIKNYAFSLSKDRYKHQNTTNSKSSNNINSRFSIGLIIPLESLGNDLNDVIFNNWDEISHYLIVLQKLIIKKLILTLNNSLHDLQQQSLSISNIQNAPSCPYIVNKRIQFPNYILQNENDLNNQLIKLIKLIHYNSNIPKLINSNSLMRSSINNSTSKFNPMLLNWTLEVLNWLEFKDGRTMNNNNHFQNNFNNNSQFQQHNYSLSSGVTSPASNNMNLTSSNNNNSDCPLTKTFLASLLALLIPLRHSLTIKPLSNSNDSTHTREITRVVIMTGNPVVAKKLIFILNGLIPDNDILSVLDNAINDNLLDDDENSVSQNDSDVSHNVHSIHKIPENTSYEEINSNRTYNDSAYSSPSPLQQKSYASASNNAMDEESPSKNTPTRPIPIRTITTSSFSSSDNSLGHSTSKGWEIPCKTSPSTTTTPYKSRVETGTSMIPITQNAPAHRSSLSKSSSMAYLSSSLTSSLSSSASNYSLSKMGGSFMEKWKNSFTSNQHSHPTQNTSNQSLNLHGFSNESNDHFPPPTFGSLSKRNSVQSLRTPSPAIDHDEILPNHGGNPSITNTPTSVCSASKLSRTQSMFDLYNNSTNHNGSRKNSSSMIQDEAKQLNSKIGRSKSSIYTPISNSTYKTRNVNAFNSGIIKSKCSMIMLSQISTGESKDKTLHINPICFENGNVDNENGYGDESTITSSSKINDLPALIKHKPLAPNVAFSEEFRPEFILQSCPISSKLESQVMTSMKNDLLFYQNNCEFEKVISRSVFISLRAREIKVIEMNVGEDTGNGSNSNNNKIMSSSSSSPLSNYNQPPSRSSLTNGIENIKLTNNHANQPRKNSIPIANSSSYKTIIKKMYSPTRNLGDTDFIKTIENNLDDIYKLFQSNYNNQLGKNQATDQNFNEKLASLISTIL